MTAVLNTGNSKSVSVSYGVEAAAAVKVLVAETRLTAINSLLAAVECDGIGDSYDFQ